MSRAAPMVSAPGQRSAMTPAFVSYSKQVIANAKTLANELAASGFRVVSGGTDTHLMLVDVRPKKLTGKAAETGLEQAAITCNKNGIPFDPEKPAVTSGIRLGSPAATTRGFGKDEFGQVGKWIGEALDGLAASPEQGAKVAVGVRQKVAELCDRFPIYRA